jgi:hypothetical protein
MSALYQKRTYLHFAGPGTVLLLYVATRNQAKALIATLELEGLE